LYINCSSSSRASGISSTGTYSKVNWQRLVSPCELLRGECRAEHMDAVSAMTSHRLMHMLYSPRQSTDGVVALPRVLAPPRSRRRRHCPESPIGTCLTVSRSGAVRLAEEPVLPPHSMQLPVVLTQRPVTLHGTFLRPRYIRYYVCRALACARGLESEMAAIGHRNFCWVLLRSLAARRSAGALARRSWLAIAHRLPGRVASSGCTAVLAGIQPRALGSWQHRSGSPAV